MPQGSDPMAQSRNKGAAEEDPADESLTYYEILDVAEDATAEDIVDAYKELALLLHPDKGGTADEFDELNKAYKVLKNAGLREAYDESLRKERERDQLVEGGPSRKNKIEVARVRTQPTPGSKRSQLKKALEHKRTDAQTTLKMLTDHATEEDRAKHIFSNYKDLPRDREMRRDWVSTLSGQEKVRVKKLAKEAEAVERKKWDTWANPTAGPKTKAATDKVEEDVKRVSPVQQMMSCCRRGHQMECHSIPKKMAATCDLCKRQLKQNAEVHGCKHCEWHECAICFKGNNNARANIEVTEISAPFEFRLVDNRKCRLAMDGGKLIWFTEGEDMVVEEQSTEDVAEGKRKDKKFVKVWKPYLTGPFNFNKKTGLLGNKGTVCMKPEDFPRLRDELELFVQVVAEPFEFTDVDSERSRLEMKKGKLVWLVPDNADGWQRLQEGPFIFNKYSGMLSGTSGEAALVANDKLRLLEAQR